MREDQIKEIQEKLNREYSVIGSITIEAISEGHLNPSEIEFVEQIMDKAEPLDSDEPIVVSKEWDKYILIDGYHRLKYYKEKKQKIKVIVLESFVLTRKADSLLEFMQSITGRTICFLGEDTFRIDDRIYYIEPNEGCGGCGNGWSSINIEKKMLNKEIEVKKVEARNKDGDYYDLYINNKLIAKVDTGYGNGYYGGDFEIIF